MSSKKLTTHDNKEKRILGRGSKVTVKNQVTRDSVKTKKQEPTISAVKSVTEAVNIRVDNHIRNDILGFVTLGKFDSYKEFCEYAVEVYKETMSEDELKRHNYLKETYEIKDFERAEKKKKK